MIDTISCSAEKILRKGKAGQIAASIAQADEDLMPKVLIITFKNPKNAKKAAKKINGVLAERSHLDPHHSWAIRDGKPIENPDSHCFEVDYQYVIGKVFNTVTKRYEIKNLNNN
jgi:hypothetical protein